MRKRAVAAVATVSLAPLVTAALCVRPASAADSFAPFGFFSLTAVTGGARTAGDIGVGGGLLTLDTGSAYISGRLDASPSSAIRAAAVEPGTLARTLIGTVNTSAGSTVITTPDADVAYPGTPSARTTTAGPREVGPLTATAGDAQATASPNKATGSSLGAQLDLPGVLHVGGSFSSVNLDGDKDKGHYLAEATSDVGLVSIADVLVLRNVSARASIESKGSKTVPKATLTVGSASVAGTPVSIDSEGVHVLGQNASVAALKALQDTVNGVLKAANIEVRAFDVTQSLDGRSAIADTGGVLISVKTPDLPAGIAANSFSIALGKTTLTGVSSAPYATTPLPSSSSEPLPEYVPPPVDVVPGETPAVVEQPSAGPAPTVSQPTPRTFVVAGRTMSARTALAAFGCWQLISLSGATLYAFVDRRRRLRSLEAS